MHIDGQREAELRANGPAHWTMNKYSAVVLALAACLDSPSSPPEATEEPPEGNSYLWLPPLPTPAASGLMDLWCVGGRTYLVKQSLPKNNSH